MVEPICDRTNAMVEPILKSGQFPPNSRKGKRPVDIIIKMHWNIVC